MELNSRMMSILSKVASGRGDVSVKDICDTYGIKKRTFYYDFKKINLLLEDKGIEKIELLNGKCCISGEGKRAIRQFISGKDLDYYKSASERTVMISLYIGLSREKMTIAKFSEMFDISKNTVLADFRKMKEEMQSMKIGLVYDLKNGYRFDGNESIIRKYLYGKFREITSSKTYEDIRDFVNSIFSENGTEQDYWESFRACLLIYEELLGTDIVDTDFENCVFMLATSYIRSSNGCRYQPGSKGKEVQGTATYESARIMMQRIEERMGLSTYASEIIYMARGLMAMKNFRADGSEIEAWALEFTEKYVSSIERIGQIKIHDREKLIKQMANHIMPMRYRVGYSMQIENPLTNSIIESHEEEFKLAKTALEEVEPKLAQSITNDELAYLAVFIASGTSKYGRHEESNKILIICAEGVATALMIQSQLERLLGDYYRYEITSIKRAEHYNFGDYLMVVTTLDTEELRNRALRVGVLLSEENEKQIFDFLGRLEMTSRFSPYELARLIEVNTALDEEQMRNLTKDLLLFLNTHREHQK